VVHHRDATASSLVVNVWGKVFAHFRAVAVKCHHVNETISACQDEFFVNNPLDIKENDENALDLALHQSWLSQSQ
jgi:hypothetical protein